jgi:hypothetical protein
MIAAGGSGQVWRAFDLELQRAVAVKVPRRRLRRSEGEEEFLTEARKVARLKHPGIVPVHDVGRHEGAYFIVSELVEGADLGKCLRRAPFTVREAVRLVAQVARHLHHAHDQGFIHRDIKPANLLLDGNGVIYVTDFGIALTDDEVLSRGHDGCGTLAYMSPEQLHGDSVRIDARTDIYSLGMVLYELLTRRLPFKLDTPEGLREQILRQEPLSPRRIDPTVAGEVERICLKCLAKSPANRYGNAEALADDLTCWLNRRRTNWLAVAGMLSVIGLLCLWLVFRDGTGPTAVKVNSNELAGILSGQLGSENTLFNEKDLKGWVAFKANGVDPFSVGSGGTLRLMGGPKGHLRTERTYSDFVLRLEFMLPEGGRVTGNGSGILLRMTGPDRSGASYLEANIGKGNTGDIWWASGKRLIRYRLLNERPIGAWNAYVIVCEGDRLTLILNGQIVNEVRGLKGMVGHIGIVAQGTDVWFRNIRLSAVHPRVARACGSCILRNSDLRLCWQTKCSHGEELRRLHRLPGHPTPDGLTDSRTDR